MSLMTTSPRSASGTILRRCALGAMLGAFGMASAAQAQPTPGSEPASPSPQTPSTGEAQPGEPPVEVERFQDWAVRCGQPKGAPREICEMLQERSNSEGRPILGVAVAPVATSEHPGMLIILPLGIALPEGVALQVDEGEETPVEVQRCQRRGCEVEVLLEPGLLGRLKAGREANVLFHVEQPDGIQRVSVPISLLGFTAALDEILS